MEVVADAVIDDPAGRLHAGFVVVPVAAALDPAGLGRRNCAGNGGNVGLFPDGDGVVLDGHLVAGSGGQGDLLTSQLEGLVAVHLGAQVGFENGEGLAVFHCAECILHAGVAGGADGGFRSGNGG